MAINKQHLTTICATVVVVYLASVVCGQYNSDSSDELDGKVLSQAQLAKLMRNSNKLERAAFDAPSNARFGRNSNARNLHSNQLQFSPSQNTKRANYGNNFASLDAFPSANSRSSSAQASNNNNDDDDDDANDGANFNANFDSNDDGQSNADIGDSQPQRQANGRSDDMSDAGFAPPNFDSADFGPTDAGFGLDDNSGRLRQAGSSSAALRNQFGSNLNNDDDAGIPAYNPGPNSAVNANDNDDDEPRSSMPGSSSQSNNEEDDD